jgi:hypothetical protein
LRYSAKYNNVKTSIITGYRKYVMGKKSLQAHRLHNNVYAKCTYSQVFGSWGSSGGACICSLCEDITSSDSTV